MCVVHAFLGLHLQALWFTADNGPHVQHGDGRSSNQATNGLRQCKASLYEGGIRVAGVLEWPDKIKANRETEVRLVLSTSLSTRARPRMSVTVCWLGVALITTTTTKVIHQVIQL